MSGWETTLFLLPSWRLMRYNEIYLFHYPADIQEKRNIRTPELTTLGVSAKGWIRRDGNLYLHKAGKYEIPADQILTTLNILHVYYFVSLKTEIDSFLTKERKEWLEGAREVIVNAGLFTSEDTALVTFEEFRIFCENYGLNPYKEAGKIDRDFYLKMQIADYILNNNDRHEQNWGFLMDSSTGKLTGYCPLFDHDHAFSGYPDVMSQTTEEEMILYEAAAAAQKELRLKFGGLDEIERPAFLSEEQWKGVQERKDAMLKASN